MEKYKFKQYLIPYKRKCYKVVVFEEMKDLLCFDNRPCEDTYEFHGYVDEMEELVKAYAILIRDPQAIVYIPLKKAMKSLNDSIYVPVFNVVMTRHTIDAFKPAIWFKIKPLIQEKYRIHNYVLNYDAKKLVDYFKNELKGKYHSGTWRDNQRLFRQTELGNTVFMQHSINDYYHIHYYLSKSINECKKYKEEDDPNHSNFTWWWMGGIMPNYWRNKGSDF